jgi:sulfur carrier protein ThiS
MPVKSRATGGAITVKVLIRGESRAVRVPVGSKLSNLMSTLEMPLTSCIAVRGGTPIPSDEPLRDGDRITLLETFSGG